MKMIFVVLFVICISQIKAIDEDMIRIGYTYSQEYDAYYRYINVNATFHESNEICSTQGSKLFFPESEEEAKFAAQLVSKKEPKIWIGAAGTYEDHWNILHNVEGKKAGYLETFKDLQQIPRESGVLMLSPTHYIFENWYQRFPYICRKINKAQYISDERLAELKKNEYVYDKRFNSLYKYISLKSNYISRLWSCNVDGGTIFFPESKEECLVLKKLKIFESISIGISKQYTSQYMSVEGKSMFETYVDWAWGEPKPNVNYTAIDNRGKYYTVSNYGSYRYICRIKLPVLEFSAPTTSKDMPEVSKFFETLETIFPSDRPRELLDEFRLKKYKHLENFNSFYKFYEDRTQTLWTAALICSSDGSSLFYPESEDEAKSVFELIPQKVDKLLIGIMKTSGKYYTLPGKLITHWNNTKESQNLTMSSIILHRDLEFENVNPTKEFKFICKKSYQAPPVPKWTQDIDLTSYGYNYRIEWNAWYKYYSVVETFEYAFMRCLLDGASLFAPNGRMELKEIMSDMEISNPIWVGLTKFLRNYFVTVEGTLIDRVFYSWATNQPNLKHDYVALNTNGKFYTTGKFNKNSFICKKTGKANPF